MSLRFTQPLLFLVGIFGLCTCGGGGGGEKGAGPSSTVDIYVAGYEWNGTNEVAVLWKNGATIRLADGTNDSEALGVTVSGSDVIAVGYEMNGAKAIAKYWKLSGNAVTSGALSDGTNSAMANAVGVSGSDIYIVGTDQIGTTRVAMLWKNSIGSALPNGTHANSISFSGADVFVTGVHSNTGTVRAWKNGSVINFPDAVPNTEGYSIAVANGDVYVAGYWFNGTYWVSKVWKNGFTTLLTNPSQTASSTARGVTVNGGDVYVASYDWVGANYVAKLWKNGVSSSLSDGTQNAVANAVTTLNSNVYVAGQDGSKATVWINGVPMRLGGPSLSNATARSIFVLQR